MPLGNAVGTLAAIAACIAQTVIPAKGPVDLIAASYRLVGTASASPYGELTINQLPPPSEGPECGTAAPGCEADRPQTTSKRENDRDMSYVPSAGATSGLDATLEPQTS